MKIVNLTPKKPTIRVSMLETGSVYRMAQGSQDALMVIEREIITAGRHGAEPRTVRSSVSLTNGRTIPWNGHEQTDCVVLNATLEVSE